GDREGGGIARLGEQSPGLCPVLLGVPPEARELLQLGLWNRPLRARTREGPDVLEAGECAQQLAPRVAIDAQRQSLTDANVRERLHVVVDRDTELDDERRLLDDDLVAELLADALHLGVGQVAELDVSAAGPDGGRADGRLGADEELVAIEVWPVLDEVVGVPLPFERRAGGVALELEGPGADDVRLEVVRVLVEVLLRIDDVPR